MIKTKSPQKLILASLVLVGVLVVSLSKTYASESLSEIQSNYQNVAEVIEDQSQTDDHKEDLILEPQASIGQLQVVEPEEQWEEPTSQVLFLMIVSLTTINVVALAATSYEKMMKNKKETRNVSCES